MIEVSMMTMNWAAAMSPRASQRRLLGVPAGVWVEDMLMPFFEVGRTGGVPPRWARDGVRWSHVRCEGCCRVLSRCCPASVAVRLPAVGGSDLAQDRSVGRSLERGEHVS